jgi:hypothetical protein
MVQEYPDPKAWHLWYVGRDHFVDCSVLLPGAGCVGDGPSTGGGREHARTATDSHNTGICQPHPNAATDSHAYSYRDRGFGNQTANRHVGTNTHPILSNQCSICDANPIADQYANPHRHPSAGYRHPDPHWHPATDQYANFDAYQYRYFTPDCDRYQPTDCHANPYRNDTTNCIAHWYPNKHSNPASYCHCYGNRSTN